MKLRKFMLLVGITLFILSIPSDAKILLIDDDADLSFESEYLDALNDNNYNFTLWNISSQGSPDFNTLEDYPIVIWFTGNEDSNTLSATDQENLADYLDSSNNLFISGQDIGYELVSWGPNDFYNNYLRANMLLDDVDEDYLNGVSGDVISTSLSLNLSGGNNNYPSSITPNDATIIFNYTSSNAGGALRYKGDYGLVYFAFPFEAVNSESTQSDLIERIVQWFATFNLEVPTPTDIEYGNAINLTAEISCTPKLIDSVIFEIEGVNYTATDNDNRTFYYDAYQPISLGDYDYNVYADTIYTDEVSNSSTFTIVDTTNPTINSIIVNLDPVDQFETITISADINDNFEVDNVLFEVDGVNYSETDSNETTFWFNTWNTSSYGTFSYTIYAIDTVGLENISEYQNFEVTDIPPQISNCEPEDNTKFSSSTTSVDVYLDTHEQAECRYSLDSDFNFDNGTVFDTTNSTQHETEIDGLSADTVYNYYIKCIDMNDNINPTSHKIHFLIKKNPVETEVDLSHSYGVNPSEDDPNPEQSSGQSSISTQIQEVEEAEEEEETGGIGIGSAIGAALGKNKGKIAIIIVVFAALAFVWWWSSQGKKEKIPKNKYFELAY